MTEPTSCSVRTDSFSSESIRMTPWLRSCMDKTPRPGGVLPSSTGLEEQEEPRVTWSHDAEGLTLPQTNGAAIV